MLNRAFGRFVKLADTPKSGSWDLWVMVRFDDADASSWPNMIVLRPLTGLGEVSMGAFLDSSQASLSSVNDSLPHSEHDDLEHVESEKGGQTHFIILIKKTQNTLSLT